MKKRLPFLAFAALVCATALATGGCGSSDDTQGQDANSTTPVVDAAPEADAVPDSSVVDAASEAATVVPEAAPESAPPVSMDAQADAPRPEAGPDATAEAAAEAGNPTPEAGSGLDLDACSLPDGGIPDAAIGDTGATTSSCLNCINTSCGTEATACNGDCLCASQVISVFECTAGGQSIATCLATAPNPKVLALGVCVEISCRPPCGL